MRPQLQEILFDFLPLMAYGLRRLAVFLSALSVGFSALAAPPYAFPDCTTAPLVNNTVCDVTKDPVTRAAALIDLWTTDELANNTVNSSPGVPRLGLPPYNWWSEALHGVAGSPGVNFSQSGDFSSATSFPQPILMGAAFDDPLIHAVATIIGTEARAFSNIGRAGLDYWTPNINPFKDPRWGRGQETPGEDPFHLAQYVYNLIVGLQGGLDPKPYFKIVADCKHFAAYDLDNWEGIQRFGFNAIVTQQDLSEYYLPPFQSCVRDAKVASVMCSYNAINGVPSCGNKFLLQDILRDTWGFNDERWVTSDCDAVATIFVEQNYTTNPAQAAADALLAGTDVDCGTFTSTYLPAALDQGLITVDDLKQAVTRQYASLVRLGYFDPPESQPYRQISWSDVNTPTALQLAHTAAVEGMVLLKNDGTLPLSPRIQKLALIGPWVNATTLMQGNYFGAAPFLVSPLLGAQQAGFDVEFVLGATVKGNDTSGFAAAVAAAKSADAVIFAGGLDETLEDEALDRLNVTWPGVQLDLVAELEKVGKPLIVAQFGGGQLDDTVLKNSHAVDRLMQSSGVVTQASQEAPPSSTSSPARSRPRAASRSPSTLPIHDAAADDRHVPAPARRLPRPDVQVVHGHPVFEFGFGLHYTTFHFAWGSALKPTYSISKVMAQAKASSAAFTDLATFDTFPVRVTNTGKTTSDYVALLFASGSFGPSPRPNKSLVAYSRVHGLAPGKSATVALDVTLGTLARADEDGVKWLYPGTYTLKLDTTGAMSHTFELTGEKAMVADWPKESS
ncbi:beta-xylosidase [Epithele typhae]|uniref:beta-xylosidase n=1 Tax=Epithele typhae TaxID=378194 RepID=UPI0020084640|nr:beta-xylosidase [Epithele typhae]KAH9913342.1 beta-xylosidase [Epithele typhae]